MNRTPFALLAVLAIALSASATTVSFAPPAGGFPTAGGPLPGNATTTTIGGIVIDGYTLSGGTGPSNLSAAPLFGRNEGTADQGIGICSVGETCTVPGGGDSNELSNETNQEVLRLTLPSGNSWVSVALSSLDNNGGGTPERGLLLTDGPNNTFTVICAFAGGGPAASGVLSPCSQAGGTSVAPVFAIPTAYAGSLHLYFVPFDWNGHNTNNDFLVAGATITSTVPEPGSLALMGSGLLALAGAVRRRIRL
ncbi:MAG: PEP-CTERM sorting domain-containing protein [Acidobacteria bacterium]|nr:PEP-CTERM sorting domain-containing protein [Acidobacteriota bacterium]